MPKFRHLPTLSLEDVTHNFEQLESEGVGGTATLVRGTGTGAEGKEGKEGKPGPELVTSVHLSAAAEIGEATATAKIKVNTVDVDTASSWEATNKRFQPKTKGYYLIRGQANFTELLPKGAIALLFIYKNGVQATPAKLGEASGESSSANFGMGLQTDAIIELNGTTDYIELFGKGLTEGSAQLATKAEATLQAFLITIGQKGEKGTTGEAGVAGATGPAGLSWKGVWASGTEYALTDAVEEGGNSYISIKTPNKNKKPSTEVAFWELLAEKGEKGLTGTTGATGSTGATGAKGEYTNTGPWVAKAARTKGDSVTRNGSSYACIKTVTLGEDAEPGTAPTIWEVLAEKGATGATGATGAKGENVPGGVFKSIIATEQASAGGKEAPELLATPDRVEFTLTTETVVAIWINLEAHRNVEDGSVYLYVDGARALGRGSALNSEYKVVVKEPAFQYYSTTVGAPSGDEFNRQAEEGKRPEPLAATPYWVALAAGAHKIELRMGGSGAKFKNRSLWVALAGGSEGKEGKEGAAGSSLPAGTEAGEALVRTAVAKVGEFTNVFKTKKTLEAAPLLTGGPTLRGNSADSSQGAELLSAVAKEFGAGWEVGEGWTVAAKKASHAAGFEATLKYPPFVPEVGATYQVQFTTEAVTSGGLTGVDVSLGGSTFVRTYGNAIKETFLITALTVEPLKFGLGALPPTGEWVGKLGVGLSIKKVTFSEPAVTFQNKESETRLEMRAPILINSSLILGTNAGRSTGSAEASGTESVIIGAEAGISLSTGRGHTIIGFKAGEQVTNSNNCILLGASAGRNLTAFSSSVTAIGRGALERLRSGSLNTAIGLIAGSFLRNGARNFILGAEGWLALEEGSENISIGSEAGGAKAANKVTLIGTKAEASNELKEATAIGFGAKVEQNESIVLGKTTHKVGIGTGKPGASLEVEGTVVFGKTLKVKEGSTIEGAETIGKTLKVKETLTAEGAATVAKTLKVGETFTAEGAAVVEKTLKVKELITAEGGITGTSGVFSTTLKVKEAVTLEGELKAKAIEGTSANFTTTLKVTEGSTLEGTATVGKTLKVKETLTAEGAATVAKTLKVTETLTAEAAAVVGTTLQVKSTGTFEETVKIGKKLTVETQGLEVVKGVGSFKEGLTVEGATKLEGTAAVAKTLKVTELLTAEKGLTVEGLAAEVKLPNQSIVASMIGVDAVATSAIEKLAVTAAKLAPEAVTTSKIEDHAVTDKKLEPRTFLLTPTH